MAYAASPSNLFCCFHAKYAAVLEFWLAQEGSDYGDGVDHAENQARVHASVLEALLRFWIMPRDVCVGPFPQ
jgi:hypothetical protein